MSPLSEAQTHPEPQLDVGVADFFGGCGEKIAYLVEPFLPEQSFVLVMGPAKAGKTWFAAWLASEVASKGLGKVVLVEEEGSKEILRERLLPFVGDNPTHLNGALRIVHRVGVRLDNLQWIDRLVATCQGAALVVMDPLVALHTRDENDQAELSFVLRAIQYLITRTGASVLLLHHTRKGPSWESGGPTANSADARGSSALAGNVDSIICIRAVPESQRVEGQVRFIVENTGSRVAAPFERRTATVRLEGGPEALTWATEEEKPPKEKEHVGELLSRILDIVPTDPKAPLSRTKIRALVRVKMERVSEAVDLGIQHQLLTEINGRGIYKIDLTPF